MGRKKKEKSQNEEPKEIEAINWKEEKMFDRQPQQKEKEGCKIKVKRDSKGNIKEYSSNGKCSRDEIQQFKESVPKDFRGDEDYE